jgi:hypothetical protein
VVTSKRESSARKLVLPKRRGTRVVGNSNMHVTSKGACVLIIQVLLKA